MSGADFEDEVRRVAEAIWGLEVGECQPKHYRNVPGVTEIDACIQLRDVTHLIMATTLTSLDKTKQDVAKLNAGARVEARRGVPVKKWFITSKQLNAEHIEHARTNDVEALTLANFRARYFDGAEYLRLRRAAPFGSARDPGTSTPTIKDGEYVELGMSALRTTPGRRDGDESAITLDEVVALVRGGNVVVITGEFGAGKSLTTREIFLRLAGEYLIDRDAARVPLAINLRENWGLRFGQELLDRHARSIGFGRREDLTTAWRAGMTHLLLDGFDELASQAVANPSDRDFMRNARSEALAGVRDLVRGAPDGSGVLLCGRNHYFDNTPELVDALGLNGRAYVKVRLHEFSESEAAEYLRRHGADDLLPDWLPRKPLLLGWLVTRGMLGDVLEIDGNHGFGYVWSQFLDLICAREAEHEKSVMNAMTIRRVLERLAAVARSTASGTGPLTSIDLAEAYRSETGHAPGEGVVMQLQRLPGVSPREQDPTARSFIDADLLWALQGSAVARCASENSTDLASTRWVTGLREEGSQMAAHILCGLDYPADSILDFAHRCVTAPDRPWGRQVGADALMVACEMVDDALDARGLRLVECQLDTVDLERHPIHNATIENSVVESLNVAGSLGDRSITFVETYIGRVSGATAIEGVPGGLLRNCEVGVFDDAATNAAVVRLDIPPQARVMVTVLRKLFVQRGSGRIRSAFARGLPPDLQRFVDPCVDLLISEGLATVRGEIVHPVRKYHARAASMIAAGEASTDPVMAMAIHRNP